MPPPPFVQVLPCTTSAPAGECVLSRMALLLLRFSYKAWIFGAVFYWATWLFLLVSDGWLDELTATAGARCSVVDSR